MEENKNADLVKVRQKNAPYTRSQRRRRRAEVYRLHFERGMAAIRIAEAMKVDRNTVNSDLKLLYHEAVKDYAPQNFSIGTYVEKQLFRLETQRDRLGSYLQEAKGDTQSRIAIERLISDIDFRLMNAASKIYWGHINFWDQVAKSINEEAKKKNIDIRFTSIFELYQISMRSRQSLDEIKEELDRKEELGQ